MKTLVLTAGVWPTEKEAKDKMRIYMASCKKFGICPNLYVVGRQFPGYRALCLDYQLEYLKTVPTEYTHIIFSDGWDCFFTAPLEEIIGKYVRLGSPEILCSAFYQLGNVSDAEKDYPNCFDDSIRYRYPNRGAYIAEREAIIDAFERMLRLPRQTGDDAFNWYDLWATGWRPMLDSNCEIFQVATDDCVIAEPEDYPLRPRRLYNQHTKSWPCVWHHSGGFSHQSHGKDDRMIPWAKKLEII